MELKTNLDLIKMLAEKNVTKQSVKKILQQCGPGKYEDYDKPSANMNHAEAMQMAFKWIGCQSTDRDICELRLRVDELAMTYGVRLANLKRSLRVTHC